jgi:DNA-binding transcriptional ArsR family regulator
VASGYRSLLWYLLVGTRGGPNRIRILEELQICPRNAHQLAEVLGMDYRTIRHHARMLEKNGLIHRPIGLAYASPYELSPDLIIHFDLIQQIRTIGPARRSHAPDSRGEMT